MNISFCISRIQRSRCGRAPRKRNIRDITDAVLSSLVAVLLLLAFLVLACLAARYIKDSIAAAVTILAVFVVVVTAFRLIVTAMDFPPLATGPFYLLSVIPAFIAGKLHSGRHGSA